MIETTAVQKKEHSLLSVVVPVYNSEEYLEQCIDSILNQTYQNIEIILVDDGSTDSSNIICDRYSRECSNIIVIHNQNMGATKSRLCGLENSNGEFVGFVDSDDWIDSDFYNQMMIQIVDADVQMVIAGYVLEKNGNIKNPFVPGVQRVMDSRNAKLKMFENKEFNWSLCDKVYIRNELSRCIEDNKLPYSYGEDTLINWLYLSKTREVAYVPKYGYYYRLHFRSITHQGFRREKYQYFEVYKYIVDDLIKQNDRELLITVIRVMLSVCFSVLYDAVNLGREPKQTIIDYIGILNHHVEMFEKSKTVDTSVTTAALYNYFVREYEVVEKSIDDRDRALIQYANGQKVYLYGAGRIGEEALYVLRKLDIKLNGVVVTDTRGDTDFFGLPLISIDTITKETENRLFILALNENNTRIVTELLESYGINDVLDIGKYSAFY